MKTLILILILFPNIVWGFDAQNVHLQDKDGNSFGESSNPVHVSLAGGGSGTVVSGTIGKEAVYTGATTVGSGIITDTGTNVGIGTITPQADLTVKQQASEDPFHVASSASTSLFKVRGDGNVGINSTAPGQSLDVQGTIRAFSEILTGTGDNSFNVTGGNTGVGNSTPGTKLDVTGTLRATGFTLTGNNATTNFVLTASDSAGDATWAASAGGGSGTVNSGTAGQASYYATSTNAVSGTSNLIFSGSNVGINSASPGQVLDVLGTLRSTGLSVSTAIPTVSVCGIGGTCTLGANSTDYGGNIGIGTIAAQDISINFGHTWSNIPSCWCGAAVSHSSIVCGSISTTTTATTFTKSTAGASSTTINYGCSPSK